MNTPPLPSPTPPSIPAAAPPPSGNGCLKALGVMIALLFLLVGGLWWYVHRQFNAKPIEPTVLAKPEQVELERKIELVEHAAPPAQGVEPNPAKLPGDTAKPENREIVLTEREINGMLNHNADLGKHMKIFLEKDRIRADVNFESPKDAPFIGGKTIRLAAAMDVKIDGENVLISLTSLKVGGIPVPNAWINDMRDKNMADQLFGGPEGVKKFARGIESFRIESGVMTIKLRE